ncbi:MAG: ABC transporter permease subunit, partial [Planctomycetota bacterium]
MIGSYFANGRLLRLCLKELRESLRDRRTLITLVLMPILVYPLLSMAMQRLIVGTVSGSSDRSEYIIGVANEDAGEALASAIAETAMAIDQGVRHSIQIRRQNASGSGTSRETPDDESKSMMDQTKGDSNAKFSIVMTDGITLEQALESGQIDLAVSSARSEWVQTRGNGFYSAYEFEVEFRDADVRSERAMLEFRKAMELVNEAQAQRFRGPLPTPVKMVSTATGKKVDAMASLAGILPLILILMTITGAVYPAIDLTAGERERGTMEAMIATPAPRFLLLLSKYVAVVTVAVLTALANLFASWITLSIGGLGRALLGERGFSLLALVQILPLLVIFAAFFSAILLAMCSFARSFKEAQAYLIPVMLVSLAPALVTL